MLGGCPLLFFVARRVTQAGLRDAVVAVSDGLLSLSERDYTLRLAIEERVSLSPDALTGMEQNLRFPGAEASDCKIFGLLL